MMALAGVELKTLVSELDALTTRLTSCAEKIIMFHWHPTLRFKSLRNVYLIAITRNTICIIQSFAYIWLHKGNQNDFLKHPKIKWLDGGYESL